jgi:hypothetical protein
VLKIKSIAVGGNLIAAPGGFLSAVVLATMAVFASSHARADCREDPREVRFDNAEGEQGQNGAIMRLKRYNCDLPGRPSGGKIQVEFIGAPMYPRV